MYVQILGSVSAQGFSASLLMQPTLFTHFLIYRHFLFFLYCRLRLLNKVMPTVSVIRVSFPSTGEAQYVVSIWLIWVSQNITIIRLTAMYVVYYI